MKFLSTFFLVTCLAFGAAAQVTNTIKISQLPFAGSVNAADSTILLQGGVTKQATILQLNSVPLSSIVATNSQIQIALASHLSTILANGAFATNAAATNAAALAASSLSLSNAIVGTNAVLNNYVAAVNAGLQGIIVANANADAEALAGMNADLTAAINSLAASVAAGATNGGMASFSRLVLPTVTLPLQFLTSSSVSNVTIDFSQGSQQRIVFPSSNPGATCFFKPINWHDGDNVWLHVYQMNNSMATIVGISNSTVYLPGGRMDSWYMRSGVNYAADTMSGNVRQALLNWQVFGTNIIFSMSMHP